MASDADQSVANPAKAKVFISYSRRDAAFVDRLAAVLSARGFEPLIDRQDPVALQDWSKGIAPFYDWWREIERLIASADTLVFVISPDSIASEVCRQEVGFAVSLNKRLAPIVHKPVIYDSAPEALRRLHWLDFRDDLFEANAARLVTALEANIDWIRKHTELSVAARKWDTANRPQPHGLLLRPPLLDEAEAWTGSRPPQAPELPPVVRDFIEASRKTFDQEQADEQRALRREHLVAARPRLAHSARARSHSDEAMALRIAVATVPDAQADLGPFEEETKRFDGGADTSRILRVSEYQSKGREWLAWTAGLIVAAGFGASALGVSTVILGIVVYPALPAAIVGWVVWRFAKKPRYSHVACTEDGRLVAIAVGKKVEILDANTGVVGATLAGHKKWVRAVAFSRDGKRVVTGSFDATARVWDALSGERIAMLEGCDGAVRRVSFSPDGGRVLTTAQGPVESKWNIVTRDSVAHIWDVATSKCVSLVSGQGLLKAATFTADGRHVIILFEDRTIRVFDGQSGAACVLDDAYRAELGSVLQALF